VSDDDFLLVEASDCPMSSCAAPAGSPCRTGKGRVAAQYHTARFRLVPRLARALAVPVPPFRKPGAAWAELPRPAPAGAAPAGHVRIGYARASTIRQPLDTQTDSLRAAGISRTFAEKFSTRAITRPELDKAVTLAREIRASGAGVTIVVHEHKRLGRGIELAALAEQLRAAGIGLEFLTGELQGSHDPSGVVFTVLAALSGMEREYIRDRTWKAMSPPAPAARPSAARPSPSTPCSPSHSTCAGRTTACATSPPGWSSPPGRRRASTRHRQP
jgi:Resolvase, N terminal domain